jgi:hypothetical protein
VKKISALGLVLLLVIGLVGWATTTVAPREGTPGVVLFDNETGADAAGLLVIFNAELALSDVNIFPIGGVGTASVWFVTVPDGPTYTYVYIVGEILAGATVQIPIPVDYTQIGLAYWE